MQKKHRFSSSESDWNCCEIWVFDFSELFCDTLYMYCVWAYHLHYVLLFQIFEDCPWTRIDYFEAVFVGIYEIHQLTSEATDPTHFNISFSHLKFCKLSHTKSFSIYFTQQFSTKDKAPIEWENFMFNVLRLTV